MSVDLKNQLQAIAANIEAAGRDILSARQNLRNMEAALDQVATYDERRNQRERLKTLITSLEQAYDLASNIAIQVRRLSQ